MSKFVIINQRDMVLVALEPLAKGSVLQLENGPLTLLQDIPAGHKAAIVPIHTGEPVIKYAYSIGTATQDIQPGEWVHTHNLKTGLDEHGTYLYRPFAAQQQPDKAPQNTFSGFMREDGRAAIRNEIWIIPTVGCVNDVAQQIARQCQDMMEGTSVEGIFSFSHPYGCSQMGDDHDTTRRLLASLAKHPNAAGVLVIGLGCENNTMDSFKQELGSWNENRMAFMVCQDVPDEIEAGCAALENLVKTASQYTRQEIPLSELIVGVKCGGSDGFSGITANPVVGAFSDMLVESGGSTILTEVPEMFGAEQVLLDRCISKQVYDKAVAMVEDFKHYYVSHGQVVYENPSPGNKDGGITTLEDKSLGCVQKGGTAPVVDVIGYTQQVKTKGLTLLSGPGNDLVSCTAMAAAGAHLILFTTGRGTPFGAPVPTVKISTNTGLFEHKKNWIDFNAGTVAQGQSIEQSAGELFDFVKNVASGKIRTKTETSLYRDIAIFKDGVTL